VGWITDTGEIRRRHGLPEAVRLRADAREAIAYLDGAKEAVIAVASSPGSLPRHPARGRGALRRVESSLGPLVAREYRKGGMLRHLRGASFLGRWRPFDELTLLRRLQAVRVPVPEAVGAVVRRRALGWRGFLLTREVDRALDLETYLRDPSAHPEWSRREVLVEAGRTVRALHEAGVRHADLHPKNLLLDPSTAGVLVLDFDRAVARDDPLADEDRLRNLVRLARSVEKLRMRGVRAGARDAVRFLTAYGGSPEAARRWLARARAASARGLSWHVLWWRLSGQVPRQAPQRSGA
jgi:tRNA A-37 threonylcarbamoyl transferase component Bud32